MSDESDDLPSEIYFTFLPFKNFIKVTAIDALTKVEVSVSAPRSLSELDMKRLAFKKLLYVLRKQNDEGIKNCL